MSNLTYQIRRRFNRVSWRHPVLNVLFHLLDPIDAVVRRARGLGELPRYSARVRSNGVTQQFGGQRFAELGRLLAEILHTHAHLEATDQVLEIGCGCGRTAIALTRTLAPGTYTGVDIDPVSIAACRRNRALRRQQFTFRLLDVHHRIWNPEGAHAASDYTFPFEDGQFDVIFLISVFTHMLPADVAHYAQEIGRMLAPTGRALVTAFLMDAGTWFEGFSFPHQQDGYWVHNPTLPEKAVGYPQATLDAAFARAGLTLVKPPLLGQWRQAPQIAPATRFAQDILVYGPGEASGKLHPQA